MRLGRFHKFARQTRGLGLFMFAVKLQRLAFTRTSDGINENKHEVAAAQLTTKVADKHQTQMIRAADAKEVGMGNPAEETYCRPNRLQS